MKIPDLDDSNLSSAGFQSTRHDFVDKNSANSYDDSTTQGTTGAYPLNDTAPKFEEHRTRNIRVTKKVTVFDVAAYILDKLGSISSMKLQKLTYYCQAWSLVWDETPLFSERIEAWANGPVIPDLFSYHRGQFIVSEILIGNIDNLNSQQRETIDAVLGFYGDKPAQWLIDLSHSEMPWQITRKDIKENEFCNREIPIETIAEYYSSILK